MRTVNRVPKRARPTTAYELCELTCQYIVEEPKRYFQERWCVIGKRNISDVLRANNAPDTTPPICGTMACRAGCIVVLHDGKLPKYASDIANRANEILNLCDDETGELFSGFALNLALVPGTKAYAIAGANGMRKFMKRYKAHLQARLLKDVPKRIW